MEQHSHGDEHAAARPGGTPDTVAPDLTRRSFLKAAPLGALAVVAGSAGAAEAPAAPAAAPQVKRGYHETEHIRRYYETAAYW
jgi:hypothetical protein